jgi:hypothetical protein
MCELQYRRFDKQMTELTSKGFFTNEDGTSALKSEKDPKRKYGPGVMLPKKPKSAYFIFQNDNLKTVMEKEKIKMTEAVKKISQMWKSLPQKKMKVYEKKNQVDIKRYEKQMADLMKNGFFLMDDGTKSCDHIAKPIKKASKSVESIKDVPMKSHDTTKQNSQKKSKK